MRKRLRTLLNNSKEMNKKRLTIKEFSRKLGVSTATVSRAFSTKGRISEDTRKFILSKAGEMGYRANANARNLILQKSDSIGFFYPALIQGEPDYFIAEIMMGINEAVSDIGMRLHIYPFSVTGSPLPEELKSLILDGALDGVIILGGTDEADLLIALAKESSTPCITISDINRPTEGYVGFNTATASETVGKYFVKSGRKNPAFISGIQDHRKLTGFKKGLGKLAPRLTVDKGGTTFSDGYQAFKRIIAENPAIDALFCANDVLAIGFMRAATEKGIKVPEDISVIGCDNIKFAQYYTPSLTTLRIPKYDMGRKSVAKLIETIGNKARSHKSDMFDCELIMRESS